MIVDFHFLILFASYVLQFCVSSPGYLIYLYYICTLYSFIYIYSSVFVYFISKLSKYFIITQFRVKIIHTSINGQFCVASPVRGLVIYLY